MLIRIDTFIAKYFAPGDAPMEKTVRSWIRKGIIKGKIINTGQREQFWVDADSWESPAVTSKSSPPEPVNAAVVELTERILKGGQRPAPRRQRRRDPK